MPHRVHLLGETKLAPSGGEPQAIKANRKAIAYLGLHQPKPVSRKTLANELWPEADTTTALNRLRVALTQLRATFGTALLDSEEGIRLDPAHVEVDVWTVKERIKHASDEIAPESELEELSAMLDLLECRLLPGYGDDWALEAQADWSTFAGRTAQHIADLAMDRRQLAIVAKAAKVGLVHEPANPQLWTHALNTGGPELLDEFRAARRRYRAEEGEDFPDELVALSNEIALGKTPLKQHGDFFDDAEREFAGQMLERVAEINPDLALEIFGEPATAEISGREVKPAADILDDLLARAKRRDDAFARGVARAMGVKALLDDWGGVLELSTLLDGVEVSKEIKPIILNSIALAKANIRDWKGAIEAGDEAVRLDEEAGQIERTSTTLANKACYLYLQGDFEESEKVFDRCAEMLQPLNSHSIPFRQTLLKANRSLMKLMSGDFSEARQLQEECYVSCLQLGMTNVQPVIYPSLGMLRIEAGQLDEAINLIHTGLRAAYLMGARRLQQISLEYAAGALGILGRPGHALAILDWVNDWRIESGHTLAPAEVMLIQHIVSRFPDREPATLPASATHKSVAHFTIRELRKAEQARLSSRS